MRSALPGAIAARVRTVEHCNWRVTAERFEFRPDLAGDCGEQQQYAGFTMSGFCAVRTDSGVARTDLAPVRQLDDRFACERQTIYAGVPFTPSTAMRASASR